MSRALRIVEGPYGRVNLMEATTPLVQHAHPEHLVLAKVSGADGAYRIGSARVAFTRADLVFVNALELHDNGRTRTGAPTRLLAIYLRPSWLAALNPALFEGVAAPFPRHRERITPALRARLDALAAELLRGDTAAGMRIDLVMLDLAVSLVDSYVSRGRRGDAWHGSRFADHRIRRAMALMRANPRKDLHMADIASEVGLSRSRFYDLFQACAGVPPQAYLDMLCVERAIGRLAGGAGEVGAVSSELGFSTQGNFARFFARQIGIAPAQYRRACAPALRTHP